MFSFIPRSVPPKATCLRLSTSRKSQQQSGVICLCLFTAPLANCAEIQIVQTPNQANAAPEMSTQRCHVDDTDVWRLSRKKNKCRPAVARTDTYGTRLATLNDSAYLVLQWRVQIVEDWPRISTHPGTHKEWLNQRTLGKLNERLNVMRDSKCIDSAL